MQNILHNWIKNINTTYKKKRLWIQGSCIAGCLVVFCTFYALILPAITMEYGERTLDCPLSVHAHTDVCKNEEGAQICGQADFVVHAHADGCYDAEGTLTCLLPEVEEHTHTEDCYTSETELICTEGEHFHGDACYEAQSALTCEKDEVALHSHGEDCYETNEDEEEVLICTMLEVMEHVHSDGCFVEVDADADSEEESQPASLPAETETTALTVEEKVNADAVAMAADTGDAAVVASGTCGEDATWVLTDDGVLRISGTGDMEDYGDDNDNAPWYAYSIRSSIKSVVIEKGVTSIGDEAFYDCDSLTSITIPESVTSIGEDVFSYCGSLASITLPEGVTSIGDKAFYICDSLASITLPEGVTYIGKHAFYDCDSLASITLPGSLTNIGTSAFCSCDSLTSITIPEGVTSGGLNSMFDFCENLTDIHVDTGNASYASIDGVLFNKDFTKLLRYPEGKTAASYEVPDGVTTIVSDAFVNCDSLTSVTIPDSVTYIFDNAFENSIRRLVFQVGTVSAHPLNDSALEEIIIGEQVDGLELETLKIFASGSKTMERIVFTGPNYFHCTGNDYTFGKLSLTAGEYYTDEYGVVYRLEGEGTATVWYVPEGLVCDNYTILAEIQSEVDPEVKYTVTAIRDYAFQDCAALGGVTIPDGVTQIGAWAFNRASSLSSVNGETCLRAVLNKWSSAGANSSTFADTALWKTGFNEAYPVATGSINATDRTGRQISLSISENKDVLTGQNVQSTLTIDKGDEDNVDVIRVYFQFESSAGALGYELGTHYYEINENEKIAVNFCQSNTENIYYLEVPSILAGQTLTLNLPSTYANYSAGGMAMIWLEVLTKEEAQTLGNGIAGPEKVHLATWKTEADEFEVLKHTTRGTISVKGDGTSNSQVALSEMGYTIKMKHTGDTSNYGKDPMTSADFVDILTLPEPFEWRDGVVEAIRNGNYDCGNYTTRYTYWYVMVDGEMETLAILYDDGDAQNVLLDVDDDDNIIFGWTYTNSSSKAEIKNFEAEFKICKNMIVADAADIAKDLGTEASSITYSLPNNVYVTEHFAYSDDQYDSATAKREISVGAAECKIEKLGNDDAYMGEGKIFEIILKNEKTLPYTELMRVEDTVCEYLYITPADMEEMFFRDTYGKELSITIKEATLTNQISRLVTGTDGKEYTVTQQQEGVDTDYEDKTVPDSSAIPNSTTITIGWDVDKSYLILSYSYNGEEIAKNIGEGKDYGSIQEALNGIGYLVTEPTTYTCTWNQKVEPEKGLLPLYSGQKRVFYVRTTVKDTFMRLARDQDWYIIDGSEYEKRVRNYAYGYDITSTNCKYDETEFDIYRDFKLNKEAYLNGETAKSIEEGEVLTYRIDVDHKGGASYHALPLVDNMEGGQILLVSVSENAGLSGKDLEKYEINGKEYYILNKPGTYEKVQVGTHLADRVVVSKIEADPDTNTKSSLDTMIYWYLTQVSGEVAVTVEYPALVSPEKAGMTEESNTFELSNEVWLNDHGTHRLYDQAFIGGTILRMNKKIITNMDDSKLEKLSEHDPDDDIEADRSVIHDGEKVVYRLHLEGVNGPVTVKGSSMYDVLPASLNNYWSEENVAVSYLVPAGTTADIQNRDSWYIEGDVQGVQQCLRWKDDFSATIDGPLYIYVILTFPDETWGDYCQAYGNRDISNTFYVDLLQDEVFHNLSVSAEVLLQKSVYKTGHYTENGYYLLYPYESDASSLRYYANNSQFPGVVTYYVTLYNSGDTRVYLSSLQDVLPCGFTFYGLYIGDKYIKSTSEEESKSNWNYGYDTIASLTVSGDEQIIYKKAYIQAVAKELSDDQQVVSFSFNNTDSYGDLHKDEKLGKYYLDTGEALVFAYHCATNDYIDTRDAATNTIAMPYYDYNGAGVNLNTGTLVDRKEANGLDSNNGSRDVMTTGQAESLGMNSAGADNSTQWLSSDVTLRRGDVMPGITKSAQVPFADSTEAVDWDIRVSNSGTRDMQDYTITDVMMAPYQFTDSVGYKIYFDASTNYYAENTSLFTFGERHSGDEAVTIKFNKNSYSTDSVELKVGGDYQDITTSMNIFHRNYELDHTVILQVRLYRENGNEILQIRFPADEYNVATIPAGGNAVMTLQTANLSGDHFNKTFINTSYITPSQPFDTGAVSQGNYTIFDEKDSVVSEANVAVAYGYATSSQKSVVQLENLENEASSTNSTNFIVLPDVANGFRYTLTVENTGGDSASKAMDKLVLIDNLPQKNDHVTFYPDILRYSEFKVDFADADGLNFAVSVNGTSLDSSKYVVEFSEKTEFDSEDWKGTKTADWYSWDDVDNNGALSEMRSVRVKILDETGTLIPAEAVITASFNACVDTSQGVPESSSVAWNSFGYRYSLLGDSTELEAAPQKVGVKMPSVPVLVKELVGSNGNAYFAREDATFRFVICEGEAIALREGYTKADVFTALGEKKFTVVDLTVEAGKSTSNAVKLDDQRCWSYTDGVLSETTEIWSWTHLSRYTIVELPLESDSVYTFDAFDRIHPNNYTFSYNAASNRTITCSNVRDVWEILVSKTCETTRKPLSGAVFGIYSTKESDKISDENFEALTASLRTKPEKKVESWYLMDIQTTNADGTIRWSGLTEESYYVQELQAPDGYSFEQEGKVLTRGNGNSVTIEVTNKPGYKLPETGGPGTKFLTTAGLLLMVTTLVLLFKRRWGGAIIG